MPDAADTVACVLEGRPGHVPAMTSLSRMTRGRGLRADRRPCRPALGRGARRHPGGPARAAGLGLAHAIRAGMRSVAGPRKLHVKDHRPTADFSPLLGEDTAQAPGPNGMLRLLGVGRLVAKKGFGTVVDACGLWHERGVPFEALIAGLDDAAGPALRARMAELGRADRIRLVDRMSQAELHEEYDRASAFCLPCRVLDNGDRDRVPEIVPEAAATVRGELDEERLAITLPSLLRAAIA